MSVHENDQTVSVVHLIADPTLASVSAAESAVAAFKLALKELGERVPANDVRAVLTTSGLRLEVTAAPTTTVEHYGTPAPVEEIAEFIGDRFQPGEKIRALRDTESWGGTEISAGAVLTVGEGTDSAAYEEPVDDEDTHTLIAGRDAQRSAEWLVDPTHFERVAA